MNNIEDFKFCYNCNNICGNYPYYENMVLNYDCANCSNFGNYKHSVTILKEVVFYQFINNDETYMIQGFKKENKTFLCNRKNIKTVPMAVPYIQIYSKKDILKLFDRLHNLYLLQ